MQGLTLLKDAYITQMAELDRCNRHFWELQEEISEIDYLIDRLDRKSRRREEHEKRLRVIKRKHNREIRRRIFLGLRMAPVGSGRSCGMVHPDTYHLRRSTWRE